MSDWSLDQARKTYSIPHWADGYFDVNAAGHVVVTPTADGPAVSLPEVVDAARAAGAKLPLLVRFPDILGQRLGKLQAAFAQAQSEWDYAGGYTAVYPIKVNQHRGVAGTLASHHGDGFGLEAGSKPELMAVLALSRPGGLIVCNGYKDREYIRLALIGRKLGLQTFIVIEKPSELNLVLEEARALDVKPGLGVRMRLASLGAGKWQNSGGDKAKFGLSPRQVLDLWKTLRDTEYADSLNLLHFHMGSQISNVRDIANGMREATRYFVELSRLGAKISHVDVGGGLGIDYEGTALAQLLLDQLRPALVRQQYRAAAGQRLRRTRPGPAAHRHRMRARDDRAPRGADRQRLGSGAGARRPRAGRARRRTGGDPPPARDP